MKKLLALLFSLFLFSSPSVFAETYFCDGFISHILKRQGSVFSYKSPSVKSTLEIVKEDAVILPVTAKLVPSKVSLFPEELPIESL